jgi:hypothetical protein
LQSLQNQRVALVLMEANDAASIIFENITRQLRTANAKSRCVPLPLIQHIVKRGQFILILTNSGFTIMKKI